MRRQQHSQTQLSQVEHQSGDEEQQQPQSCPTTSSPSQILERVQSDRVTVTKPEEDRRRRTIIVEKKNGSYGFTLQSYGIHYKKEQEIEMITYVDYVDYDGPAYRAGMREGDVILSINGTDMEKADHKTLVNFIKNCDTRMRMVVLFEDCVRKVELHMRYIQLQRILQNKMGELEKLCVRERQLLEGKWKTHSLPARKKASHQNTTNGGDPPTPTQATYTYCRPTVSTEDVAKVHQQQKPSPHNPPMILYQYLDPHYRYMLQPSTSSSGEYLLTFEPSRHRGDQHHFIVKTPCDVSKQNRGNQTNNGVGVNNGGSMEKQKKNQTSCHNYAGHLCNPCIQSGSSSNGGGDNTSLEAYDLASPCCDPHCVPSGRRRSSRSNHKDHHSTNRQNKRDSKTEETQTDHPQQQQRSRPHSQITSTQTPSQQQQANVQQQSYSSVPRRYFHLGAGLVSQCSLHSCTSSELSAVAPTTMGESSASYTTSLSTDTLYWDGGSCDMMNASSSTRQLSVKSSGKQEHQQRYNSVQQQQQGHVQHEPVYVQYASVSKPKSWDNLTTKAFGGYGFGYGYSDTTSSRCASSKGSSQHHHHRSQQGSKSQGTQYIRVDKHTSTGTTNNSSQSHQYTPHAHRRYFQPTKSTESLLSVPKYSSDALSDSSASCECLDVTASSGPDNTETRFFQSPRQSVSASPTDPNFGYYSSVARRSSKSEYQKNVVSTSSEATRL